MKLEIDVKIEIAILESILLQKEMLHEKLTEDECFSDMGRMIRAEINQLTGKIMALKWVLNERSNGELENNTRIGTPKF